MTKRILFVAVLTLAVGSLAGAAHAAPGPEVDWLWGGGFHLGLPTGDFDAAVDEGYGAAGHFVALPRNAPFGLRGEVSALVYGSRDYGPNGGHHSGGSQGGGYPDGGFRTDTWFGNLLLGPELRVRSGGVRPYLHALAGLGYFATTTEPSGCCGSGYDTTQFDDTTFAWAVGGGVELAVGKSTSIDLGVRYLANGTVDYFTEASIGAGGELLAPRRGEANVVTFTVGIAFGR
jgi:opacity protein-like surface antigen